jgi:hypothetical protein
METIYYFIYYCQHSQGSCKTDLFSLFLFREETMAQRARDVAIAVPSPAQ